MKVSEEAFGEWGAQCRRSTPGKQTLPPAVICMALPSLWACGGLMQAPAAAGNGCMLLTASSMRSYG